MDTIILNDLEVHCHVGVPDVERTHAQPLMMTVELHHDLSPAAASDELHLTTDSYAVSRRLIDFGAPAVTVEVKKFAIPEARQVSVRLSRSHS